MKKQLQELIEIPDEENILNKETLENIFPFRIKDKQFDEKDNSLISVDYIFTTPKNNYRVEFYSGEYRPEDKTFELSFGVNKGDLNKIDTFQMTGEGNVKKIILTIVKIIEDFVSKFDVNKIKASPTSEKRKRVYKTIFNSIPSSLSDKVEISEVAQSFLSEKVEIPDEGGYTETWLFDKMQKGEKDILFLVTKHPGVNSDEEIKILTKAKELGYGELKVDKKDGEASIIYRPTSVALNKAKKLQAIANKNGGYLIDNTPEEAREIGTLLDYSPESINKFISRVYKTQESLVREIIRKEIRNLIW